MLVNQVKTIKRMMHVNSGNPNCTNTNGLVVGETIFFVWDSKALHEVLANKIMVCLCYIYIYFSYLKFKLLDTGTVKLQ